MNKYVILTALNLILFSSSCRSSECSEEWCQHTLDLTLHNGSKLGEVFTIVVTGDNLYKYECELSKEEGWYCDNSFFLENIDSKSLRVTSPSIDLSGASHITLTILDNFNNNVPIEKSNSDIFYPNGRDCSPLCASLEYLVLPN